jgi:hypothetical protein
MQYPGRFELIYLTHDRSTPKDELKNSEQNAGPNSKIYWLNWHSLFLLVQRWLGPGSSRPYSEKKILLALKSYLIERNYQTFVPWQTLAIGTLTPYTNKPIRLQGSDSNLCEDATLLLRKLTDIRDQAEIGGLVDELLNLSE